MVNVAIYFFALKFNMNLGLTVFSSKYLNRDPFILSVLAKLI